MIHNSITESPLFVARIAPPKFKGAVRQYNPAIADHKGARWIAWRVEFSDGLSRIALGLLRGSTITKGKLLPIGGPGFVEDPRLVVIGGKLLLQCARVTHNCTVQAAVAQEFHELDGWAIAHSHFPGFFGNGLNGVMIKNWTSFDHGGRLHIHHRPGENLVAHEGGQAVMHDAPAFLYPFGVLSGRSPGIAGIIDGEYLALCGGRTLHPFGGSRYYLAAWTFSADPARGFAMQRISAKPILWAADHDERRCHPKNPHYSDCCIYPAGMIHEGGSLLVSAGVNDTFMALLRIPLSALQLQPITHPFETRELWSQGDPIPPGCAVVQVQRQPLREQSTTYFPGELFVMPIDRAGGLGHSVQIIHQQQKEAA